MKLILASMLAMSTALAALSYADTGDHYVTGQVRVGDSLRLDGTLTGTGWNLSIDSAKLAAKSVDTEKLMELAVETGKLNTDAVTSAKILNATIANVDLADLTIQSGKLAANSVDTEKIMALAVETGKLNADAVTTAKVLNAAIDTAKLAGRSVDTGKINFADFANVGSGKIVCIMSGNSSQLGTCINITAGASGACDCQ